MTTPDRAATNRANAQHSTGPRTPAGKQRASLNALRHGLTGHTIVLPTEDLAAYQRHSKAFFDDYQPQGAAETQLVQNLVDATWRLNRIPALESNLFSLGILDHAAGIDSENPEVRNALAMAKTFREQHRAFASLSMIGQRLSRQFEKSLQQLRELQCERLKEQDVKLRQAAQLLQMHEEENDTPYDPAEDGFVLSPQQIKDHIRMEERTDVAFHSHLARRA